MIPNNNQEFNQSAETLVIKAVPVFSENKFGGVGLKQRISAAPVISENTFGDAVLRLNPTPKPDDVRQEHWGEWVGKSGISPEIAALNLRSIEGNRNIAKKLGWDNYTHTPGWLAQSINIATGHFQHSGQFKPDEEITLRDGKKQKYISFLKGDKPEAIYICIDMATWRKISEKYDVPISDGYIDSSRTDLGFWRWVKDHPELPISLTEGIKKAAVMLSNGFIAITITGVWNGQLGKGKELIKSLDIFAVQGREFYFVFDSDIVDKEGVRNALTVTGRLIRKKKSSVRVATWDPDLGKGVDDVIVGFGIGEFEEIMNESASFNEWLKGLEKQFDVAEGTVSPRDEDDNCVGSGTFDAHLFKKVFDRGVGDWVSIDDAFYQYAGEGYWRHIQDDEVLKLLTTESFTAYVIKNKTRSYPFASEKHINSAFKFNRKAITLTAKPHNAHLRCFKNVTVDMRTGEALRHDPRNYLTAVVPYEYHPNQPCPEVFKNFICQAYGEDMLEYVRAYTSMFLDPTAPYGIFVYLVGESGSGKGTLLRFWGELFGNDNFRSINSFTDLATQEKRHQTLTGAALVALPDVGGYLQGLKAFYELVDNGAMTGRALFSSIAPQRQWNCRFVVASVEPVQVENAGDGWKRRARMLPTLGHPGKVDPYLGSKLAEVKAEVISWALSMPREQRDKLILDDPTSERILNLQRDTALTGDPVRSFIDLCLRPDAAKARVENHTLHSWYVAYCQAHGYTPKSMATFISHLKAVLPKFRVERHWQGTGEDRAIVSASWRYLSALPDVFTQSEDDKRSDTTFRCVKSKCVEGGVEFFDEFDFGQSVQDFSSSVQDCTGLSQNPETIENALVYRTVQDCTGGRVDYSCENSTADAKIKYTEYEMQQNVLKNEKEDSSFITTLPPSPPVQSCTTYTQQGCTPLSPPPVQSCTEEEKSCTEANKKYAFDSSMNRIHEGDRVKIMQQRDTHYGQIGVVTLVQSRQVARVQVGTKVRLFNDTKYLLKVDS